MREKELRKPLGPRWTATPMTTASWPAAATVAKIAVACALVLTPIRLRRPRRISAATVTTITRGFNGPATTVR